MARHHKPKKGSRAFWPKKRARRIYPNVQNYPALEKPRPLSFAAYKAGMTRVSVTDNKKGSITSGQNVIKPVTILDCPPLTVCAVVIYVKTPYGMKSLASVWMNNISKDLYRKTNIPGKTNSNEGMKSMEKLLENAADVRILVHTRPRQSGIGKKRPELFEIRLGGKDIREKWEYAKGRLGSELRFSDVFAEGEMVDTIAVTKGKGFQGPVKRFGIKIRPRKTSGQRRHVGTLGPVTPARVLPGVIAMPGQLGFQTRTECNKMIVKLGEKGGEINPSGGFVNYGIVKGHYAVISGSIPGPKKRLIIIRKAIRPAGTAAPVTLNKIFQDSQQ